MSTFEGYREYIEGYYDACRGNHEYIGGCSIHLGDTMSTSGGYHDYIGGCSVHWGFSMEIKRFLPTCSPHAS